MNAARWLVERVDADQETQFWLHKVTGTKTEALIMCKTREMADRVLTALEWLDSAEEGVLTAPKPKPRRKPAQELEIIFTPAKKRRTK